MGSFAATLFFFDIGTRQSARTLLAASEPAYGTGRQAPSPLKRSGTWTGTIRWRRSPAFPSLRGMGSRPETDTLSADPNENGRGSHKTGGIVSGRDGIRPRSRRDAKFALFCAVTAAADPGSGRSSLGEREKAKDSGIQRRCLSLPRRARFLCGDRGRLHFCERARRRPFTRPQKGRRKALGSVCGE